MKSTKLRRDIFGLFSNTVENQLIAEQIERRKVRLLYCTSHFLRQINAAKKNISHSFWSENHLSCSVKMDGNGKLTKQFRHVNRTDSSILQIF